MSKDSELVMDSTARLADWATEEMLNLGCGLRFHRGWTNLDFHSQDPCVRSHDLRTGIPFRNDKFSFAYHSHVLEHFNPQDGVQFLKECWRVLRPGGVIRVAVPDLEGIARAYLDSLELAVCADPDAAADHRWMCVELLDQLSRHESGGQMRSALLDPEIPNAEFVVARLGTEARRLLPGCASHREPASPLPLRTRRAMGTAVVTRLFTKWREYALRLLLRDEYAALKIGRFRLGGEVHLWMYDRYSLGHALRRAGFKDPVQMTAFSSACHCWKEFYLDSEADGSIYKPDSLFMEARKD